MTIIPWYLEVDEVLRLASEGASVRTIAAQTGIGKSTVSRIIRGERVWDKNMLQNKISEAHEFFGHNQPKTVFDTMSQEATLTNSGQNEVDQ